MADYTDLPNTAVGVGGIPSGTTVTALRDNPIAIAEGAAGAPRIVFSAIQAGLGTAPYGGVGTYVLAYSTAGDTAAGGTVAGSTLRATSAARQVFFSSGGAFSNSSGLTGTWRAMGLFDSIATGSFAGETQNVMAGVTLWLRTV